MHLTRGPTPAAEYIGEMITDLVVHAWDLARATDGDTDLEPELVTAAMVLAERLPDDGVPGLIDPPLDGLRRRAAAGTPAGPLRPQGLSMAG